MEEGKCECCCSADDSKNAEDLVRDLINLINVYKEEEKQDVTTRIDPETADKLVEKLEGLAKAIGDVCKCE